MLPVGSEARMVRVSKLGTNWPAGTSTCFRKKNGRLRVNAVCTL